MFRGITVVVGVGLTLLWLIGLEADTGASHGLAWLDLVAGGLAFGIASGMRPHHSRAARGIGLLVLSAGLFAMWLVRHSSATAPWQEHWNLGFALALFLAGLGALSYLGKRMFPAGMDCPQLSEYDSPTGFGHGFLFPQFRHRYLLPGKRVNRPAVLYHARSDKSIEEDIHDRLSHDCDEDASYIHVSVKSGEVSLSGVVGTQLSRQFVEKLTHGVSGVKSIHNDLDVRTQQTPGIKGPQDAPKRLGTK